MPISDKVVDDPNQSSIRSNFQMMLDDREHIRAGGIVKPSVKGAVSTHPREIACQSGGVHHSCLPVLLTVSVLYCDTASSDAIRKDKSDSREEITDSQDLFPAAQAILVPCVTGWQRNARAGPWLITHPLSRVRRPAASSRGIQNLGCVWLRIRRFFAAICRAKSLICLMVRGIGHSSKPVTHPRQLTKAA